MNQNNNTITRSSIKIIVGPLVGLLSIAGIMALALCIWLLANSYAGDSENLQQGRPFAIVVFVIIIAVGVYRNRKWTLFQNLGKAGAVGRPPAYFTVQVLKMLMPAKTFQSIIAQTAVDIWEEYTYLLGSGKKLRALILEVQAPIMMISTFIAWSVLKTSRIISSILHH